jgi:protoporphyrin/coproporphyrin ferrochelatase
VAKRIKELARSADPSAFRLPSSSSPYDALLLVSFGGPEGPDDVMPFLENVVRGKNVPQQRLIEVARHYQLFDGVSPINAQNRALLVALVAELNAHGPQLPVYWGNRHWHPLLPDVLQQMAEDGIRHALALVTSAFGSYPGCRQYLEDIERARREVGPEAPRVDKLRLFYNHPGFIEAMADRAWDALEQVPAERRAAARLIYTAHSIPVETARVSPYEEQLREACGLVSERLGRQGGLSPSAGEQPRDAGTSGGTIPISDGPGWQLVYQNRSGPPSQQWLGPDVRDHLRELARDGQAHDVVLVPIGFLSEHMEIVYDLDVEVADLCEQLGLNMVRAEVVGCHPRFVKMIRELVLERTENGPRSVLGTHGPWPDDCPERCCQ